MKWYNSDKTKKIDIDQVESYSIEEKSTFVGLDIYLKNGKVTNLNFEESEDFLNTLKKK